MMMLIGPVLANLLYSAGWLVEVPARWLFGQRAHRLGSRLLTAGLVFSVFVVLLPPVVWLIVDLVLLARRSM